MSNVSIRYPLLNNECECVEQDMCSCDPDDCTCECACEGCVTEYTGGCVCGGGGNCQCAGDEEYNNNDDAWV